MAAVLASGRRFALVIYSILTLGQATVSSPIAMWASAWWTNRASIVLLTGVNTAITGFSEFASREILANAEHDNAQRFFVETQGSISVHRQSVVNIFMTLFASLLGGPIYFIRTRWRRFIFFLSFGALNSAMSQMLAHAVKDGLFTIMLGRFVFDLCYNGTVKFCMFEFARPAILKFRKSVLGIGVVRVTQDFLTTLFRVGMLNWLGFK